MQDCQAQSKVDILVFSIWLVQVNNSVLNLMWFDLCQHVSLPHQASIEDEFSSYRGIMPKGKSFHSGTILQDQVGRLGLGVKREQADDKINLTQ